MFALHARVSGQDGVCEDPIQSSDTRALTSPDPTALRMRHGSPLHSDTHDAHIVPEPKSSPTGLTILESISFERHSGLELAHVRSAAEDISGAGAGVVATAIDAAWREVCLAPERATSAATAKEEVGEAASSLLTAKQL